jgi:peptidoglycan/xylan/chitin deacetylase (PgdA/CDA1 family)
MPRFRFALLCCSTVALFGCATPAATTTASTTGAPARAGEGSGPRLVITMDDLPVHGVLPAGETRVSVAERIVAAFKAANVPEVYGFVNGVHLEREPETSAALSAWAAAYPLGNHTWSHKNLNQIGALEFEEEVVRNEATLQRFGRGELHRWLRFPYLVEGSDPAKRDSVRAILARRGYRVAAVTMDFSDWQWSEAYARCRAQASQPALDSLERAYLDAVRETAARSRIMSRALYGRDVPYILLTHISAFNAHMMPRVLELYRREGFQFTTLESAQRDSVYRRDTDPSQPAGPTSLEARASARGLPVPPLTDRRPMLASACR